FDRQCNGVAFGPFQYELRHAEGRIRAPGHLDLPRQRIDAEFLRSELNIHFGHRLWLGPSGALRAFRPAASITAITLRPAGTASPKTSALTLALALTRWTCATRTVTTATRAALWSAAAIAPILRTFRFPRMGGVN